MSFPPTPKGTTVFIKAFWFFGDRLIRSSCQFCMIKWVNKEILGGFSMPSRSWHSVYLCCHRERLLSKEILCDVFPLWSGPSRLHFSGWVRGLFMHVVCGGSIYLKTETREWVWKWAFRMMEEMPAWLWLCGLCTPVQHQGNQRRRRDTQAWF